MLPSCCHPTELTACALLVVSGGGGWGDKQGLLSLDPQTKYSSPDEDDVESFIRSFKGDTSGAGTVVAPGSYIQFFIEGPRPAQGASEPARPFVVLPFPKFTIGTQEEEPVCSPTIGGKDSVAVTGKFVRCNLLEGHIPCLDA